MDLNDKKKKALELMKARRPAPAPVSQPMPSEQPGPPQEEEAPPAQNRFAAAIAKRRGK